MRINLMMMQRAPSVATVCGTLAAAAAFSFAAAKLAPADIVAVFQSTSNLAHGMIVRGYDLAPALMLGLALLAVVPMIAVVSPIVFEATRSEAATRRFKSRNSDIDAEILGRASTRATIAYLEVVGAESNRFAIERDMLRIGREDDNDIRIPSKDVHRYHAAIYRQGGDDWHVADLSSGHSGNGVRVNGKSYRDVLLHDGDIIELGPGRLRFRAVLT